MSAYVPIITITGQIQDFLGDLGTNAAMSVRLKNFGTDNPRVPGSCIITSPWVAVALNGTGGFSFTPIGNDVITPSNTYYEVRFSADNGNTATMVVPYQFTGTGSQDLSQIIPFNQAGGAGGPSVSNLVVKNPAALQTIVGFGLSVPQVQDLTAPLLPHTAGGTDIGSAALPFANVYVGGSATNNIRVTGTASAARAFTLPDHDSNPVQPLSGATTHQWLTFIDSAGVQHASQPTFADISGTATAAQYVTMVGDSGSGGTKGAVPAPASGDAAASKFLKADGTWAVVPNTGVSSFNSRTGAVVPATNDYSFSQISGSVAASQLPNPTASTIGGVESFAAVTHQFLTSISTSGVPASSQPAFTDLSGVAVAGQIPSLDASKITTGQIALARGGTNADLSATGGTSQVLKQVSSGAAVTVGQLAYTDLTGTPTLPSTKTSTLHQWLKSYDSTTGLFSSTQPDYGDLTGTPQLAQTLANASHKWLNSYSATTGLFTQTQPAAADLSDGTVGSGTHVLMATTVTGSGTQAVLAVNPTLSGPALTGTVIVAGTAVPDTAGGQNIGSTSLPFANIFVGGAATNNNKITSATTTGARTFTLPDADSNPVQPSSAGSHQFATGISSAGIIAYAQPAFTDISGTAAAGQYVTMVGDSGSGGTKGAVPAPAAGDAAASKFLKADGTWATPSGSGGGISNSAAVGIVPVTTDSSGDLGTSIIWTGTNASGFGEARIGSTTNITGNTSRLYVFGGSTGCNVDVQADGSTAGSDVAQVEVEGSDYATHVNSIAIRYFGPTALGTFCGITAQSVGVLDFIGSTTTAGIIRTGGNFPLVFGTNDVERLRINATGESKFSSSLAITGAVNVSQVAAPSAPTVAPHNGSASTWAYKIVAYDNNNQPTTGSTAGQTTTGAATLDSTHWNQITWSEVAGASYYKVFRTTVATSPTTTGIIGTVNSGSAMTLRDNGLAGDSSSVPTANTTGEVTVPAIVVNGPLVQSLVTKTASYSLTVNDRTVLVNSAGATTMTLPVTGSSGQMWTLKNINTGTCTVAGASGNIEGSASVTLNPSNSFDVVFDGTNFWIV